MKRVLIVDDSELVHKVYRLIFSKYKDISVTSAMNAADARDMLSGNGAFSLILIDVNMPTVNGFQFVEEMKKGGSLKDVPVVMVSSMESEELREKAHKLGVWHYVQKTNTEALTSVIEQVLA